MEKLKKRIAELPVDRSGRRTYPGEVKEAVMAILEDKRGGWSQAGLAAKLDISHATLSYWCRAQRESKPDAGKLRPVRLVSDSEAPEELPVAGRAVVLPNGIRVEGLRFDEVASLLKVLA